MHGILKFDRDFLKGEQLHIAHKTSHTSYKKHWHGYYEIICYHNCSGICILNGERFQLTEHCLFLLTPKDFHEILTADNKDSQSYILSFSEQIIDDALFTSVNEGPFFLPKLSADTDQMIKMLYGCYQQGGTHRKQRLYHLLNSILIDVLNEGNRLASHCLDMNPIIRESISRMLNAPGEDHSLGSFSKAFNISNCHFSRLFRQSTGIPFKQYLTTLRMEYAKRLLEEKQLPIIEVGAECGYHTPCQFIRAFKAFAGTTPSAYRKSRQP